MKKVISFLLIASFLLTSVLSVSAAEPVGAGYTRYEAEDMEVGNPKPSSESNHTRKEEGGHYSNGEAWAFLENRKNFADLDSTLTDVTHIIYQVNVAEAGVHTLVIGYNISEATNFAVVVNGGNPARVVGNVDTKTSTVYAELKAGENTILVSTNNDGEGPWINHDYMDVSNDVTTTDGEIIRGAEPPVVVTYTRYEAEDMEVGNSQPLSEGDYTRLEEGGHYSNGKAWAFLQRRKNFADLDSALTDVTHIIYQVNVADAGVHTLAIGYNISEATNFAVVVNGGTPARVVGNVDTKTSTVYADLKAGANTILVATNNNGEGPWMNHDYLDVSNEVTTTDGEIIRGAEPPVVITYTRYEAEDMEVGNKNPLPDPANPNDLGMSTRLEDGGHYSNGKAWAFLERRKSFADLDSALTDVTHIIYKVNVAEAGNHTMVIGYNISNPTNFAIVVNGQAPTRVVGNVETKNSTVYATLVAGENTILVATNNSGEGAWINHDYMDVSNQVTVPVVEEPPFTRYEAENMDIAYPHISENGNSTRKVDDGPYSGGWAWGFMERKKNFGDLDSALTDVTHVVYKVTVPEAGYRDVVIGYNISEPTNFAVVVASGSPIRVVGNVATKNTTIKVNLAEGENIIRVSSSLLGEGPWVNQDYLDVSKKVSIPEERPYVRYEAENMQVGNPQPKPNPDNPSDLGNSTRLVNDGPYSNGWAWGFMERKKQFGAMDPVLTDVTHVIYHVNVAQEGIHKLTFGYNISEPTNFAIVVNGGAPIRVYGNSDSKITDLYSYLVEGDNIIRASSNIQGEGPWINHDYLDVSNTSYEGINAINIRVAHGIPSVTVGGTLKFIADVYPETAEEKSITWSVKNYTGWGYIDNTGLFTAVRPGILTVKATANDGSGMYGELEFAIREATTPQVQPPVDSTENIPKADIELSKADSNSTNGNIVLPSDKLLASINNSNGNVAEFDIQLSDELLQDLGDNTNLMLNSDILKKLKESGKGLSINLKDKNGKVRYSWTFDKNEINSSKQNMTGVNLSVSLESFDDVAELNDLAKQNESAKGLVIQFAHEGILPVQSGLRIFVGDMDGFKPGTTVHLYHYNKQSGLLETLPYSSEYVVDQDGYININVIHCSDYVALQRGASDGSYVSLLDQVKVSVEDNTLHVSDNKDRSTQINYVLPPTLEFHNSNMDKASQSAIGSVSVSYSSGNERVATVDKNGKITALKQGIVDIIVTVKLYSGKTKTVYLQMMVKK
jgi:hypothetical protein